MNFFLIFSTAILVSATNRLQIGTQILERSELQEKNAFQFPQRRVRNSVQLLKRTLRDNERDKKPRPRGGSNQSESPSPERNSPPTRGRSLRREDQSKSESPKLSIIVPNKGTDLSSTARSSRANPTGPTSGTSRINQPRHASSSTEPQPRSPASETARELQWLVKGKWKLGTQPFDGHPHGMTGAYTLATPPSSRSPPRLRSARSRSPPASRQPSISSLSSGSSSPRIELVSSEKMMYDGAWEYQ